MPLVFCQKNAEIDNLIAEVKIPMQIKNNIIKIRKGKNGGSIFYTWSEKWRRWCRLDEAELAKAIPGYRELTEKARAKRLKKYLKEAQVIDYMVKDKSESTLFYFQSILEK